MKNNWIRNSTRTVENLFDNIDYVFSKTRIYKSGKKTGKRINKIIDSCIDFIIPKNGGNKK